MRHTHTEGGGGGSVGYMGTVYENTLSHGMPLDEVPAELPTAEDSLALE